MASAANNLGPHLLGRVPSIPDARNYPLEVFQSSDPVDIAYAALLTSTQVARATKDWATAVMPLIGHPVPAPAPAPVGKVWVDAEPVLDQGDTPHCVGFGGAQWGNTEPKDDHFTNATGHALYYECKVLDGEPKAEDGSNVHSLARALKARGLLSTYAWASSVASVTAWLDTKGPVVFGTDWYYDMFFPNSSGYVRPTGDYAGGHCFVAIGHLPSEDAIVFLNSWGAEWGQNGRFKMKVADVAKLIADQGEALAAVEL